MRHEVHGDPRRRGRDRQAAAVALVLPSLAVVLCLLEQGFVASPWAALSVLVCIAASASLPLVALTRPRLALGIAMAAAAVSAGGIPVLALVSTRTLDVRVRPQDWGPVFLGGLGIGAGFTVRGMLEISPGATAATLAAIACVVLLVVGSWWEREGRSDAHSAFPVDRAWLSQQIHDGVGHHLALLSLRARIEAAAAEEGRSRPADWNAVAAEIDSAFAELDRLLGELDGRRDQDRRPSAALDQFLDDARGAGVPVVIADRGVLDAFDTATAELAVAVCREAVANAAKHAAPGEVHVRFELDRAGSAGVVICSPLPDGPCGPGSGRGLRALRERLEHRGGGLAISVDGGCFVLRARLNRDVRFAGAVRALTRRRARARDGLPAIESAA